MWRFKAQIANGRPFKAIDDLNFLTADTIFESAMGIGGDDKNLVRNFERLKSTDFSSESTPGHYLESVFPFPDYEPEGLLDTITVIAEITGNFPTAPIVQLFWPVNNLRPKLRRAQAKKEQIIKTQIDEAVARWEKEGQPKPMTNALQYIIAREFGAAKKAGRTPNFHTKLFHDALYGYCFGGQDTTHSALAFLVKHFGTYQSIQTTLRAALREGHPAAFAESRNPTPEEITKAKIPYLDAFMEEVLRLNASASAVLKEAVADMEVLGCRIPKGAQMLIPLWGPSIDQPAIPVPEHVRSQSSRDHKGSMATDWEGTEYPPGEFHPERWLRKDPSTGELVFDPKAGPQMTFSLGPRECWGKRLAFLQVRLLTTLLVWNFEFNQLPAAMDNWETMDILNAKPKVCLVSLKPLY
jgi:cytochrome P450